MKFRGASLLLVMLVLLLVGCKSSSDKEDALNHVEPNQEEQVDEKDTEFLEENLDKEVEDNKEEEGDKPLEEGMAINPLTGLPVKEEAISHRPVAVTINNHKKAIPQSGISDADIIYETLAEGGITRLIAIFQDIEPITKLGPVRSARRYFLDFALDQDAIYVHYGQDPSLTYVHASLGDANLNGLSYLDSIMCWRDNSRYAPHNVYTSGEKMLAAWETVGYRKEKKEDYPMLFDFAEKEIEQDPATLNAKKVTLPYSYYITGEFIYDDTLKVYKRFQFGEEHIDELTGEQLTVKNILIQKAHIYNRPGDTEGRLDMDSIGSGEGFYITNGKSVAITWEKTGQYEPTQFYDQEGKKLEVNKGKTWIAVVPTGMDITME